MNKMHRDILGKFEPLGSEETIILYGSVASGKARPYSDIDIAVISESRRAKEKADRIADKILFDYGKVVSVQHMKPGYVSTHMAYPFVRDVMGGKVIYGKGKFAK